MRQRGRSDYDALVLDVVMCLWHTKLKSVRFVELWLQETHDLGIKAGLATQLVDERRHLRLLTEEIKRRTSQLHLTDRTMGRPFHEYGPLASDLDRLCVLHRGIKAFTIDRCGHILPFVEPGLVLLFEQITREDERHIRWADIRLARLLTRDEMRRCDLLIGRVWTNLASGWEKLSRDLVRSQQRSRGRAS